MNPIRVQFFHTRFPHFGAHSGIQQFVQYLAPDKVVAKTRAVSDSDDDLRRRPFQNPRIRHWTKRFVQSRGQAWYKLSDFAAELSALKAVLKKKVDILHFIDGEHTAHFMPEIIERLGLRVRTVATYHQPPDLLPELLVPDVIRRIHHVVLMASTQAAYFQQFLPADRISVVLHGIDTDFFSPEPGRSDDEVFRCITTGSYLRDWDLLAEIARGLGWHSRIQFHVVSGRVPDFAGLPNVKVHRGVDDETLRSLYRKADLSVIPLADATANNALLESMASGLPVVASDLPSLREYASSDAAIFLPRDAKAFASVIKELADDSPKRKEMHRAARSRAEQLAWPRIAEQYACLYESLMARNRQPVKPRRKPP